MNNYLFNIRVFFNNSVVAVYIAIKLISEIFFKKNIIVYNGLANWKGKGKKQ